MNKKTIYTRDDIKTLYIRLTNHEAFVIPKTCFKKLNISQTQNGDYELDLRIKDNGDIDVLLTSNHKISPLQRIHNHKDVFDIEIKLENGEKVYGKVVWMDEVHSTQDNMYQKTKLISYNDLILNINLDNRRLSIQEVFSLPSETIVIDDEGTEYKICFDEDREISYLSDTIISDKIINSKFKVKY